MADPLIDLATATGASSVDVLAAAMADVETSAASVRAATTR